MVGLREITPSRGRGYVQVGVVTGLIALNLYIFAAYVIPYWYSIDTCSKIRDGTDEKRVTHLSAIATLVWPQDRARRFLSILLLLFVLKQMLLVLVFPPFTGHDEVAHFSYIRTVATEHRIPIIPELDEWRAAINAGTKPPGDYFDNDLYPYCRYTLDWLCAPEYAPWAANPPHAIGDLFPSGWQYAANHPPLYYILAAPFYRLTEGIGLGVQLRLLRLLAIPFGLLVVFGTYLIARTLFPRSGFIAITAATFIAFQPQLSYEAAMVNNDITVIGIGAVFLALLIRGIRDRFPWRLTIWLGVILGVMFLFKSTAIVFAGLTAIAMIVGIGPRQFKIWIPKGAAAAAIALGMASPWYIFLYRTYGNFDALDQVAALQDRWTYPPGEAPTIFSQLFSGGFVASRWNEIWGEFGWRRIPLDTIMLWIIGVACILCAVGLVLYTVKLATQRKMEPGRWFGGPPGRLAIVGVGIAGARHDRRIRGDPAIRPALQTDPGALFLPRDAGDHRALRDRAAHIDP